jgi:Transglutaminase-like superfamily
MVIGRFRVSRWLANLLTAIPFAGALGLFVDWQHDNAILQHQSIEITKNLHTDAERIRAINDWVYQNHGFAQNDHYFIMRALGPTPIQVLEAGGDCSDKSRLVAAMLNELNIGAGLVMLSTCTQCRFIHTVVEGQHESGRMVVDPIWHIDYPAADGRFLGVRDLAWTALGRDHLAALKERRGPADKIAAMPDSEATFDYAVAINWNKNGLTRAVAATLEYLGYDPERMFRPRFLEDPKLALILFLICLGVAVVFARLLFHLSGRVWHMAADRRVGGPVTPAEPPKI